MKNFNSSSPNVCSSHLFNPIIKCKTRFQRKKSSFVRQISFVLSAKEWDNANFIVCASNQRYFISHNTIAKKTCNAQEKLCQSKFGGSESSNESCTPGSETIKIPTCTFFNWVSFFSFCHYCKYTEILMIFIVPKNLDIFSLLCCHCALFSCLNSCQAYIAQLTLKWFRFCLFLEFCVPTARTLLLFVHSHWNEQINFIIKTNHLLLVFFF